MAAKTVDSGSLPRQMLWVFVVAPPFLAALFWGTQPAPDDPATMVTDLVAMWLYTIGVGFAVHFAITRVQRLAFLEQTSQPVRVLVDAGVVVVVVVLASQVVLPILGHVTVASRIHPLPVTVRGLVLGFAYVVVARALATLRARAIAAALRADAAQRAELEAKLQALQARTNPHFLFNTLNAVASLISTDPARAEEIIEKLASLFRYALEGSEQKTVPLHVELDAVRDYLSIEHARFGERLVSHVDVDAKVLDVNVPPLLVQPLVENAIGHGLASRPTGGNVWVRAAPADGCVEIVVEDDGVGVGKSTRKGTGTALRGVRDRLALLFGEDAKLETGSREGGGFRAMLRIPMKAGE